MPEIAPQAREVRITSARSRRYDTIIVGGGIYGAMLAYGAARRNLSVLLVEREDFGAATSFNSLRIVHGGLRYLQTADLPRFFESVAERRWLIREFPDLVAPLPCLMPLYGNGLRRPAVLRIALALNDLLSQRRNSGLNDASHLGSGSVISPRAVASAFPDVRRENLQGGAVWYDAQVADSQLLLMRVLRRAQQLGADTLNYCNAESLLVDDSQVTGICIRDTLRNASFEARAPVVINATGPWCDDLLRRFGAYTRPLLHKSLAWNALLDRPALSDHALALEPPRRGSPTYFATPWKGQLLAGTVHSPWHGSADEAAPDESDRAGFINDLNLAVPNLSLDPSSIARIFCGILPAADASGQSLAVRESIIDHGQNGGPSGLHSVIGIKLTTAHAVAKKALLKIFPHRRGDVNSTSTIATADLEPAATLEAMLESPAGLDKANLELELGRQSIARLDDLVFRRTSWWNDPRRAMQYTGRLVSAFDWPDDVRNRELVRIETMLQGTEHNTGDDLVAEAI